MVNRDRSFEVNTLTSAEWVYQKKWSTKASVWVWFADKVLLLKPAQVKIIVRLKTSWCLWKPATVSLRNIKALQNDIPERSLIFLYMIMLNYVMRTVMVFPVVCSSISAVIGWWTARLKVAVRSLCSGLLKSLPVHLRPLISHMTCWRTAAWNGSKRSNKISKC